ncbi:cell division protein ZapA [Thermodesulfovibrionales bacterium]|nr:cell division protein ZapA [Thermodesulfovibrionales bacterium]
MEGVEVYITGQKYVIKGDKSAEYMKHLAAFVDGKFREVYALSPNITSLRASILVSLSIADELHRIKNEYTSISKSIKSIEDGTDTIIKLFE